MLVLECLRYLLLAGLKLYLSIFNSKPFPLRLGKLSSSSSSSCPSSHLPLMLLQQNVHPMQLRYSRHELQQFIEAILNHHLVLASINMWTRRHQENEV
jgi:hypothetical protein